MTGSGIWLIAGLGNPGRKYQQTRHNVGFMAIDRIGAHHDIALNRTMFKNRCGRGFINSVGAVLAQPMDFMNRSGPPVYQLARYFGIGPAHILIIHDDMDIDIGRIKIKVKGGHGGHKGVRSIIDALGTNDFTRIRIGIGRPEIFTERSEPHDSPDAADYVLGKFSKRDMQHYEEIFETVRQAVATVLEKGQEAAMNRYNG
ncbi:MAG: aminoacyl-tRNA hydrolase [Desulfosalsimonadaceae bacterium]